ncbi:MAG: hypothetical protein QM831_27265 [Kofleriaceae bacterium]
MKRLLLVLLIGCGGSPAPAPTPPPAANKADEAKALDQEGQDLMAKGNFADAEKKFIAAYNKDVQSQYCFDLCSAEEKLGKFQQAVNACNKVKLHNPTPELQQKADALVQQIQTEAKAQNVELQ